MHQVLSKGLFLSDLCILLLYFKIDTMEKVISIRKKVHLVRILGVGVLVTLFSIFLFSFTVHKMAENFLKQLGLSQAIAEEKISSTMLGGSFDTYGVKGFKSIPAASRSSVAKEAFSYSKKFVSSPAYIKRYKELRDSKKPIFIPVKTPEEMMKENIALYKKGVQDAENSLKKADASMKSVFEQVVAEGKKQLKEAENPNSKQYVNYRKNYEGAVKINQQNYDRQVADWEREYPSNHLLFVKPRLEQFLKDTEGIDFSATTVLKNGKQVFTDPQFERKNNRWKMAFRAGKDVVESSRAFVTQWISEIK
jgi:hypothetical protein